MGNWGEISSRNQLSYGPLLITARRPRDDVMIYLVKLARDLTRPKTPPNGGLVTEIFSQIYTLPETNSLPLKNASWGTTFLLGRFIFRGELLVSGM